MQEHVRSIITFGRIRNIALQNRVTEFLALLAVLLERTGDVLPLSWPLALFFLFREIAWAVRKYSGHCIFGEGRFPGRLTQNIAVVDRFPGFAYQMWLEVPFAEMVGRL